LPVTDSIDCFFVTHRGLPNLDRHDRLVAGLLRERGARVEPAVWTDAAIDWGSARLCVLRSTWDYHESPTAFARWLERTASETTVRNDPSLVRWNAHKSYLRDLEERGVPIVPTLWLRRGDTATIAGLLTAHATGELVLKPAYGASSTDVLHVGDDASARRRGQAHLDRLLRDQDVLVQPFLHSLAAYPERALMFVNGRFTHAVSKKPYQRALPSGESGDSPLVEATPEEIAVAGSAIATLPGRPLYARVDLVRDAGDRPCVLELELIEPTLFFIAHAPAAVAMADAIERELQTR